MAKTWEQMTQPEKIESLREDMNALSARIHSCVDHTQQLGRFHNDLMTQHTATAAALKALAAKLGMAT